MDDTEVDPLVYSSDSYCCCDLTDAELLMTDHDVDYTYCLHFSKVRFTIDNAHTQCADDGMTILKSPLQSKTRSIINDWDIAGDVWVTDDRQSCMTVKQECTRVSPPPLRRPLQAELHYIYQNSPYPPPT